MPVNHSKKMFVTDFDGTLFRSDRTVCSKDISALELLGGCGVTRVIATGRSIFSFDNAMKELGTGPLPVDYVVFSTGAGVMRMSDRRIIRKTDMDASSVIKAAGVLDASGLDYMVHKPVPDTRYFSYRYSGQGNTDFITRLNLYSKYCKPLNGDITAFGKATQLLAIIPPENIEKVLESISVRLAGFNVLRATSPLDGKSAWIEIFPATVSKSSGTSWLAGQLGIDRKNVTAVGNDYNDEDLLDWAGNSFIVDNAAEELKKRYPVVASNDDGGVMEAINKGVRCKV